MCKVHWLALAMQSSSLVERIRTLACAGQTDIAIAEQLEQEGFTPCKGGRFTAEIVARHRGEHQIRSGLGSLRRGDRPLGYTIIEMAQQLDIDPQWIDRGIAKGRIEISKLENGRGATTGHLPPSLRAILQLSHV